VQLSPPGCNAVSLDELATKLAGLGTFQKNKFLLRFTVDPFIVTVFPDGRAIIGGTDDIATAEDGVCKVHRQLE